MSIRVSENKDKIKSFLETLKSKQESIAFLEPVDHVALKIPDYPLVIKEPMDFSKIEKKLEKKEYEFVEQVLDDVQLIYDNCMLYNEDNSDLFQFALRLEAFTKKEVVKQFGTSVKYGQKSKAWEELQNQRKELEEFDE